MRFWRIKSPEYNSDYQHSYVNGSLEHPLRLPGVQCDMCGATWGGCGKLPLDCPESFRQHKNIIDCRPISRIEHETLQRELMAVLHLQGIPFVDFQPGDDFQPCFLNVPSRPRADFLWSSLGSFVVSERIKNVLIASCPDAIAACPVTLRKIGKREAKLPPSMPSTGEPEDVINEVPIFKNTSGIGPYFEIIIRKDSGYPPGVMPKMICSICKRETIDDSTREIRMTPDMWKGDGIFFLATTLHIVVTNEVKQKIEQQRPTNVHFEEL